MSRVMRLGPGDRVVLFDGCGRECLAEIENAGKNSVSLRPGPWISVSREPARRIVIASALPKGDRLKFMVEKLTELGAATFIPLLSERSTVQPRSNTLEKIRRYVIEASKQCGRNQLMQVQSGSALEEVLLLPPPQANGFCCIPPGNRSLADQPLPADVEIWLMIGPEGGWSGPEMAAIDSSPWQPLGLGPSILRTETAAIASCVRALNFPEH